MKAVLLSLVGLAMAAFLASMPASAATSGTEAEAKALLDRAIVEFNSDKTAAIARFNDPKGGFQDRDLYVFCANIADGKLTAHPKLRGTDLRTLKDKNGVPFGEQMFAAASDGKISEVSYVWPRPDGTDPVEKVSYVTKLGDEICGVGYYK
jgi:hypothetical protein